MIFEGFSMDSGVIAARTTNGGGSRSLIALPSANSPNGATPVRSVPELVVLRSWVLGLVLVSSLRGVFCTVCVTWVYELSLEFRTVLWELFIKKRGGFRFSRCKSITRDWTGEDLSRGVSCGEFFVCGGCCMCAGCTVCVTYHS